MLRDKRLAYSRHVLFFSIPQAVAHAEALILHTAQQPVEVSMHVAHAVTREFGDNEIESVVNQRAGLYGDEREETRRSPHSPASLRSRPALPPRRHLAYPRQQGLPPPVQSRRHHARLS